MDRSKKEIKKDEANILVIDDDRGIRKAIETVLRENGYTNVRSIGTGKEAPKIFASEFVNVAFIDLKLPDISGIDLIPKLRATNAYTEFVIVTGYGSLDSAVKALEFEVSAYLEKPISAEKLIRTLNDVLLKQHLKLENKRILGELENANKEIRFLNDLLVNEIDELNQSLLVTINTLSESSLTSEQKKPLKLFLQAIRKNARLTRNIRRYQEISQITNFSLVSVNLTECLSKTIDRLRRTYWDREFEVVCDLSTNRLVLANNNLSSVFFELFSIAILNDPSPTIRIELSFEPVKLSEKAFWRITVSSFQAKLIYDQRDILHSSHLTISPRDKAFQDLGPLVINNLVSLYQGLVDLPQLQQIAGSIDNYLDIYLLMAPEESAIIDSLTPAMTP